MAIVSASVTFQARTGVSSTAFVCTRLQVPPNIRALVSTSCGGRTESDHPGRSPHLFDKWFTTAEIRFVASVLRIDL